MYLSTQEIIEILVQLDVQAQLYIKVGIKSGFVYYFNRASKILDWLNERNKKVKAYDALIDEVEKMINKHRFLYYNL